jgi:hypothetical protein
MYNAQDVDTHQIYIASRVQLETWTYTLIMINNIQENKSVTINRFLNPTWVRLNKDGLVYGSSKASYFIKKLSVKSGVN